MMASGLPPVSATIRSAIAESIGPLVDTVSNLYASGFGKP
jgi:hypothetical protein